MTELPPSDNPKHRQAPSLHAQSAVGSSLCEDEELSLQEEGTVKPPISAEPLAEKMAKAVPPLITEAPPELFDERTWQKIGPQGFYARIFRPILRFALLGFVLIPVLLTTAVLALCNWIAFRDSSKVFFKQTRVGYRGQEFELWKFRTMKDTDLSDYDSWREGREYGRVTRFGSFLRRSHLDELPQIFNVIKGEMAFIGPRPEMVDVHDQIQAELPLFYRRLSLRPGITGFAQVTQGYAGNDIQAYRRKLDADTAYIKDMTLQRDLGILLVTPLWMLRLLGWQNDPAAQGKSDDLPGGKVAGSISATTDDPDPDVVIIGDTRPGTLPTETSKFLEQLDSPEQV